MANMESAQQPCTGTRAQCTGTGAACTVDACMRIGLQAYLHVCGFGVRIYMVQHSDQARLRLVRSAHLSTNPRLLTHRVSHQSLASPCVKARYYRGSGGQHSALLTKPILTLSKELDSSCGSRIDALSAGRGLEAPPLPPLACTTSLAVCPFEWQPTCNPLRNRRRQGIAVTR
jgi:hypothetical protein